MLNCMIASDSETLTGEPGVLSRILYCSESDFHAALGELSRFKVADIEERGGIVRVTCRRLRREFEGRRKNRARSTKFRENGGGSPERWTAIRVDILRRDEYRCAYCGKKANTVDHIHPQCSGGGEEYWNLVAACKSCNCFKRGRTLPECGLVFHTSFNLKHLEKCNTYVASPPSVSASASDSLGSEGKGSGERKPKPPAVVEQAQTAFAISDAANVAADLARGAVPLETLAKRRPGMEEVKLFCAKAGIPDSDAEWFFYKCEGNGWTNGGQPIKRWGPTLTSWKTAGYLPSQKHEANNRNNRNNPKSNPRNDGIVIGPTNYGAAARRKAESGNKAPMAGQVGSDSSASPTITKP